MWLFRLSRWLAKPLEGHGFYQEDNELERLRSMLDFFDRHIGAGAMTAATN